MANKQKRRVIGSVIKNRESGKPDYIKVREDINLAKGQILRLESKQFQLKSLEQAVSENKISADYGAKVKERLEKIPDFVRFEVVAVE